MLMKYSEISDDSICHPKRREFIVYSLATSLAMAVRLSSAKADNGMLAQDKEKDDGSKPQPPAGSIALFLCGDVMTGRGIDQILPHPNNPVLYERYMKSALGYVALAEEASGPIQKPVEYSYIWGDALAELERRRPDGRIINLETAV